MFPGTAVAVAGLVGLVPLAAPGWAAQARKGRLKWESRTEFGPAWEGILLHWPSADKAGPLFSMEEQNVREPLVQRGFILLAID